MSEGCWAAVAVILTVAIIACAFPRPAADEPEWPNFEHSNRQL